MCCRKKLEIKLRKGLKNRVAIKTIKTNKLSELVYSFHSRHFVWCTMNAYERDSLSLSQCHMKIVLFSVHKRSQIIFMAAKSAFETTMINVSPAPSTEIYSAKRKQHIRERRDKIQAQRFTPQWLLSTVRLLHDCTNIFIILFVVVRHPVVRTADAVVFVFLLVKCDITCDAHVTLYQLRLRQPLEMHAPKNKSIFSCISLALSLSPEMIVRPTVESVQNVCGSDLCTSLNDTRISLWFGA